MTKSRSVVSYKDKLSMLTPYIYTNYLLILTTTQISILIHKALSSVFNQPAMTTVKQILEAEVMEEVMLINCQHDS